ncbi:hypothetical protein [Streptomyces sp. NPDC059262]|uniref:hypothetical protein n=1 Tax=Streptomyces sp. NPDC059262 TaxID=3346797 RepID=UPI003693D05C
MHGIGSHVGSLLPEQQLSALLTVYAALDGSGTLSVQPEGGQQGLAVVEASEEERAEFYRQVAHAYLAEFGSPPDAAGYRVIVKTSGWVVYRLALRRGRTEGELRLSTDRGRLRRSLLR